MKYLPFLICVLLLSSCAKHLNTIHPQFSVKAAPKPGRSKPSPFSPLTEAEQQSDWSKEYKVALFFAKEHDFYRAITSFKRAYILAPEELASRRLELQYYILLCYYQAQKYLDVVYTFEKSELQNAGGGFSAFYDLVSILYDSYEKMGEKEKAQKLLEFIRQYSPEIAESLSLSSAVQNADFAALEQQTQTSQQKEVMSPLLETYRRERKSPRRAQVLNAALPGTGYLYLGQKKSAMTAFLLNGAFIAAAVRCFQRGHTAAGLIFTSFELGWYVGGINGAGLAARQYNERLYERYGQRILRQEKLFPLFMLTFRF